MAIVIVCILGIVIALVIVKINDIQTKQKTEHEKELKRSETRYKMSKVENVLDNSNSLMEKCKEYEGIIEKKCSVVLNESTEQIEEILNQISEATDNLKELSDMVASISDKECDCDEDNAVL